MNISCAMMQQVHNLLMYSPINVVHGQIADYLKSWYDFQVKFYNIMKHMVLFKIGEKFKKIQIFQTRDIIDFVRQCNFPSAQ